jgi:hypothetical protein
LSEKKVEVNLHEGVEDTGVRNNTLRGGAEKHLRVGLDVGAEDIVILVQQIRTGNVPGIGLKIEIETVNNSVAERTRIPRGSPLSSDRSVSSDEELGEPVRYIRSRKSVVRWVSATKRQQNLLPVLMAKINAWLDTRAVTLKEAGFSGGRVCVGLTSTRIGMV